MAKLDLNIGAQVHCKDQHCGKLIKLVVAPETRQVTDLIVEKGLLLKHDRVLPLSTVEWVTENEIYLNLHHDELSNYAEYHERESQEPAPEAKGESYATVMTPGFGPVVETRSVPMIRKRILEGIVPGRTVIGHGTAVENLHKAFGHVDHVVVDSLNGQITHLIVRKGLLAEYVVIPGEQIKDIDEQAVFVEGSEEELAALPRYKPRPANEILADLHARLHQEWPPVFEEVNATLAGGILGLIGRVHNNALRYRAESSARAIEGVLDVQNDLVVDLDMTPATLAEEQPVSLETRICTALAADPRTKQAVIEVIADRGVVTLQGQVENAEARAAAAEIARQQPGVTVVHNELVHDSRVRVP